MRTQAVLHAAERLSTWTGKAFSWLIVLLMTVVCVEVFKRYALNAPTAWIYDVNNMMYGTLFMMCGAYTLCQDGHVRGDFLYGNMKPRTQAALDLVLFIAFFLPGIGALTWAGWDYAHEAYKINEHSSVTVEGPPIWPFKYVIPLAGAFVLFQGIAEIIRCIVCLKTGEWPARLADAEEIDVVGEQLANSQYVDEDARKRAILSAKSIDEAARKRMDET